MLFIPAGKKDICIIICFLSVLLDTVPCFEYLGQRWLADSTAINSVESDMMDKGAGDRGFGVGGWGGVLWVFKHPTKK